MADSVIVDGVKYVREIARPSGFRRVFVINGGWIYAGDIVEQDSDHVMIDRVVMVCKWTGGQWFAGMIANPSGDVVLKPISERVEIPCRAVLYSVLVKDDWGIC